MKGLRLVELGASLRWMRMMTAVDSLLSLFLAVASRDGWRSVCSARLSVVILRMTISTVNIVTIQLSVR